MKHQNILVSFPHSIKIITVRNKADVDAEEHNADTAADNGAEESVAAAEPGVTHVIAKAENGADAGEGGIAVKKKIDKGDQGCGKSGFYVAHADVHS